MHTVVDMRPSAMSGRRQLPINARYCAAPITGMIAGMQLYDLLRSANVPLMAPRGVATGVEDPL